MGTDKRNYTIFFDGKEITNFIDSDYSVECEDDLIKNISTEVVISTKHGDINFTGTFTREEYANLCSIYEKIKIVGDTK